MGPVGQSLHTFAQLGKTRASRSTFQLVMVIVRSLGSDLLRRLTGGDVRPVCEQKDETFRYRKAETLSETPSLICRFRRSPKLII